MICGFFESSGRSKVTALTAKHTASTASLPLQVHSQVIKRSLLR
jgi:hypothetical protein